MDPLSLAQAVAREHGVACDDAVVLAGGSNALVHLRPAPVVARVMTGTSVLHADPGRWLAREVAVGTFLAGRTDRVVAPTDLLPPGPHERCGAWMTLWRFEPHEAPVAAPPPAELGRALRDLHAALAGFRGELEPLTGIRDWLARLLDDLDGPDAARLRWRLEAVSPVVFEGSPAAQPLHGDASLSNLLSTARGLVWNDFEDVCAGPVAWDVAGLASSARARGFGERDVEAFLAAYGDPGVEDLEPFMEAHALYSAIWHAWRMRA